jgi:hypothetical protein
VDEHGNYFATLGAGQTAAAPCFGTLQSDINRLRDVSATPANLERLTYLPIFEDMIIKGLFAGDALYGDDLAYACFPSTSTEFNSNGYVSGLLQSVGLPWPTFPLTTRRFWGDLTYYAFDHPVPTYHFK